MSQETRQYFASDMNQFAWKLFHARMNETGKDFSLEES